ncbi:hypothetical protein E2A64_08155 [Pseudohoeflea suaedae]|uniref:VCBS repeat-containing protein n=1 Tax=Pseudohoeflea suaedae TaxID=877384 RepID=A0A4V3A7J1_9HYPH|nr:hypothetical protein [Pseudohoeflea suaedae]TDH39045.1 hypothetical protein E2A64_08155 [Pseudohoeflea suaedae]
MKSTNTIRRRTAVIAAALAAVLGPAAAGAGSAQAAEIPDFANRIVSAASGDVDGDGKVDLVLLLTPDEDAGERDHGLLLMKGAGKDKDRIRPKAYYPDLVWGGLPGGMVGNRPSVTIAANSSIRLLSHNDSVGRHRWSQTLTLAWRDGKMMLAGYTYSSYDTLVKGGDARKCDVNLLTGRGEREVDEDEEQFTLSLGPLTVEDWPRFQDKGFCGIE